MAWVKDLRPVRQRTVRSETTKDKSGMLPPVLYRPTEPLLTPINLSEEDEAPIERMRQNDTNNIHSVISETSDVHEDPNCIDAIDSDSNQKSLTKFQSMNPKVTHILK